jgi:hypothetical protein
VKDFLLLQQIEAMLRGRGYHVFHWEEGQFHPWLFVLVPVPGQPHPAPVFLVARAHRTYLTAGQRRRLRALRGGGAVATWVSSVAAAELLLIGVENGQLSCLEMVETV